MNRTSHLNAPDYIGTMEITFTAQESETQPAELHSQIMRDLEIPSDEVVDPRAFYMLMGQTLEPKEAFSITFYAQNATKEEQKNFPVLYAGVSAQKDKDGIVRFKSRLGDFEGVLRPQDILFDFKTGKLIDGTTGEFDMSRRCLWRLFDFSTYAAKNNPPQTLASLPETTADKTADKTWPPAKIKAAQTDFNNPGHMREDR